MASVETRGPSVVGVFIEYKVVLASDLSLRPRRWNCTTATGPTEACEWRLEFFRRERMVGDCGRAYQHASVVMACLCFLGLVDAWVESNRKGEQILFKG